MIKPNLIKSSIIILLIAAFVFTSCKTEEKKNDSISLSGKIYITGEGMDSLCNPVEATTDAFQRLVFLNDSTFINIVYSCCGGDTVEFESGYYFSGTYQLSDSSLVLNYKSPSITEYVKEDPKTFETDSSRSIYRLEVEKSAPIKKVLKKLNCKDAIYFLQKEKDFEEYLILEKDTLSKYENELKANGVWKKLFEGENQ